MGVGLNYFKNALGFDLCKYVLFNNNDISNDNTNHFILYSTIQYLYSTMSLHTAQYNTQLCSAVWLNVPPSAQQHI